MNPVRQAFHDALDAFGAKKAGRIAGYKVRPLTLWHIAMLHRLDGELGASDKISASWLIVQVLRWPALCNNWRLRLAMAEPGFLNIRAWLSIKIIMRDIEAFDNQIEKYWKIWFPKPFTKGQSAEIDESGNAKPQSTKGAKTPWFMLVISELMSMGFAHDQAWKTNPGYALHLLWANREREGSESPLIDEETAAVLDDMGAW